MITTIFGEEIRPEEAHYCNHPGATIGYVRRDEATRCAQCGLLFPNAVAHHNHEAGELNIRPLHVGGDTRAVFGACVEAYKSRQRELLGTKEEHEERIRFMKTAPAPRRSRHSWESEMHGYHNGPRSKDDTTNEAPFLVGFEVEKEDEGVQYHIRDGEMEGPDGWTAEYDSSLDEGGYELITNAYNLYHFQDLISDANLADEMLNGGHSSSCGGHINISDRRFGGRELLKRLRPFLPLFLALYPRRLRNSYVTCKKFSYTMRVDASHDHYQPFNFRASRVEIRVPSAVRSKVNFLWRAELVRIMLMASYEGPITWEWMAAALRPGGLVREHLAQVYSDPKVLQHRIHLYWSFAEFYYTDRANKYVQELTAGTTVHA